MTAKRMTRRVVSLGALVLAAVFAVDARAQCCGAPATTAFYQPAAYTAYSPVGFQTVRTGWYPGYFLDRIRARLWGSPTTYVAAYPTAVTAAYAPAYTAAYAPSYSMGYSSGYATSSYTAAPSCPTCPSYTASYAAPVVQQAAAQPACPCSPCAVAEYGSPTGTYAGQQPGSYHGQQSGSYAAPQAAGSSPGCPTCPTVVIQNTPPAAVGVPAPAHGSAPPAHGSAPPAYGTPAPQRTFEQQNGAPSLDPRAPIPDRPQEAQRPETNNDQVQPEPADDPELEPYKTEQGENSTYWQPPRLFDPNDRTAGRSAAPVTTAVYQKPVGFHNVSYKPITREQAELDASGWVSSSR